MEGEMKTVVAVTGADGFIGRNLCASLSGREGVEQIRIDVGNTWEETAAALERADFVFRLAGVNRPLDPAEFETGNAELTSIITKTLAARKDPPPLLLSSSIQAEGDNPYGKSKKAAEEAASGYGKATGAPVFVYRLPNVFGKWCRPNYNSVIATWCHNTARGLPIKIDDPGKELRLVYIDDVVEAFLGALDGKASPGEDGFCRVDAEYRRGLGRISEALASFASSRRTLVMPSLAGDFERKLYATWISYLPEDGFGYDLEMRGDERGWLSEFIKAPSFGQVFVSKTKPGITRGNHWHHTKAEKFLVVSGQASIRFSVSVPMKSSSIPSRARR
jgi:UDP-2-acetamido-2,6-beta-L-arabino-hexul-4-ose reductase